MLLISFAVGTFLALTPFNSVHADLSGEVPEGNFTVQQSRHVTLYDHDNYGGDSVTVPISEGSCTNVLQFNDRTSSVLIDEGCVRLWQSVDCTGLTIDVQAPGEPNLITKDFNDNVTSISACVTQDPCVSFKENVEITFHLNGKNDLATHAASAKRMMERWFPFIQGQLFTPAYTGTTKIDVHIIDSDRETHYTRGSTIFISEKQIKKAPRAYGPYIHELTHVIHQAKEGCPKWVYEGTAEYMRDWFYYPKRGVTKPTNERFTNPWYGDWLLAYLNTYMYTPLFYEITKACQEGSWTSTWLKDRTGQDEHQWWRQMVRDKEFPWKRVKNSRHAQQFEFDEN